MAPILIALSILALAVAWFRKGEPDVGEKTDALLVAAAVGLTVVLAILAHIYLKGAEQNPVIAGLVVGLCGNLIAYFADRLKQPAVLGLAIACAISGTHLLTRSSVDFVALGICAGAGASAALLNRRTSSFATLAVFAVSFVHILGNVENGPVTIGNLAPIGIGIFTFVAMLGVLLKGIKEKTLVWSILCGIVGLIALAGMMRFCLPDNSEWFGLAGAPIAAVVIFWLLRNNSDRPQFSLALSTVMWIGLATIAFGIQKGLGIGIVFLVSTGVLLLLESEDALLSAGPLMALVLHRVFRMEHPKVGGVIDIGQHYALVGFTLGCILPLLPVEWFKLHPGVATARGAIGKFIWVVVSYGTPCLIALFLAPKGLLGFVTGLGFCGFFAWASSKRELSVLALAGGVGAAAILEYEPLSDFTDLSREDKIHWFIVAAIVLAVIAGLLAVLGVSKGEKPLAGEPS